MGVENSTQPQLSKKLGPKFRDAKYDRLDLSNLLREKREREEAEKKLREMWVRDNLSA